MLDDGLREDIGFSSGTQFLEGVIDAHHRPKRPKRFSWSVVVQLPPQWTAWEKAILKLQIGLNGPSLSCHCFLTKVNLPAHHKLLPEILGDIASEKLPFVCLWIRQCTKSLIVRDYV